MSKPKQFIKGMKLKGLKRAPVSLHLKKKAKSFKQFDKFITKETRQALRREYEAIRTAATKPNRTKSRTTPNDSFDSLKIRSIEDISDTY